MQSGVVLMVSLATLYILAMVMFWHGLWGQQPTEPVVTDVPLTLRAGQTILGVMETRERMCFRMGQMEEQVHEEEDTGP
jgi:hypothetical protein